MMENILSFLRDPEARERLRILAGIPLFSGLQDRDLARIQPCLHEQAYAKGEALFDEGDIRRSLMIVKTGKIRIFRVLKDGTRKDLRDIGPGGFIGEMALLDDVPRSASAEAAEDSAVFLLHQSQLSGLMQDSPAIGMRFYYQFARVISQRFRELESRTLDPRA